METHKFKPGSYPSHFYPYIKLVENDDLNAVLKDQIEVSKQFFRSIPEEKTYHRYAEGKWNIKEVLQHIIDTERVFAYRALAFARKETSTLPNMDENLYAENSNANSRNWQDLIEEFVAVRQSIVLLYQSFSEVQLELAGSTINYEMSAKAMGYTIAGHLAHHVNILKERYLGN
ncbi:MAG: DinB family protein [Ginsengibacter sp.]